MSPEILVDVFASPPGSLIPASIGFAVLMMAVRGRYRPRTRYERGVVVRRDGLARRAVALLRAPCSETLTVAGQQIHPLDETKHFKMLGTTGTGKSTAIRELLGGAIARGDRAIIADPDGGYLARFYARYRGDVILNPFEPDSVKWDWYAEIRDPYDVEQMAGALIPDVEDPAGQEWRGYARTFLTVIARRCRQSGCDDPSELWRLLTSASADELRPLVSDSPAQPFLDGENARMFASIRSVTASAIAALQYIQAQRGERFSVRSWVRAGADPGLLFLPYRAGQIAALRSMIATWLRLAIVEAMNGREDVDQRLWFIVDELDALGAIDGLKDALARLRKFGGRCVLGFQSVAQVSSAYGAGCAQTIVENCGNTLILRCGGSENGGTSQFAAKLIGDREIVRRQTTRGRDRESAFGSRGSRRSTNVSDQHVIESAVLASEIEQLPDLKGFLKLASSQAWRSVYLCRTP